MRAKLLLQIGFLSGLLFLQVSCKQKQGTFAFSLSDERGWDAIQIQNYQPKNFMRKKQPIIFTQGHELWCLYVPASPKKNKTYALSLSKKTLGYNEVDLRNQTLRRDRAMLMEKYSGLHTGEYLLRVAIDNKVIDAVTFEVRADEQNKVIDYDAPLTDDDSRISIDSDDILFYSK